MPDKNGLQPTPVTVIGYSWLLNLDMTGIIEPSEPFFRSQKKIAQLHLLDPDNSSSQYSNRVKLQNKNINPY